MAVRDQSVEGDIQVVKGYLIRADASRILRHSETLNRSPDVLLKTLHGSSEQRHRCRRSPTTPTFVRWQMTMRFEYT